MADTLNTSNTSTTDRMIRRSHKKSRRGCVACKKRHIKCDETKPACLQCINTEKRCSFLSTPAASTASTPAARTSASSQPSPAAQHVPESPIPQSATIRAGSIVNMVHLDLLHHAPQCMLINRSVGDSSVHENISKGIMAYAFECPYLMHQLLALSAVHLSVVRPGRHSFYRYQATELQTCALSLFAAAVHADATPTSISEKASRFLFASVLSTQVSHETLTSRPDDFLVLLDKYVSYLNLTRGIRLQLDNGNWEALRETPVRTLFEISAALDRHTIPDDPCEESEDLERLLEAADLGPASRQIYQKALQQMRVLFRLQRSKDPRDISCSGSLCHSWAVTLPAEFADLLAQRRPEALVVLAHYGGLLHKHHREWIVGDGGAYLIRSITTYLGSYWTPWLVWPNRTIAETDGEQIS